MNVMYSLLHKIKYENDVLYLQMLRHMHTHAIYLQQPNIKEYALNKDKR